MLHNILLKVSKRDDWHRGDYKQHSNAVETKHLDGSDQIIFKTTEPGFPTEDAMRSLMRWHSKETEVQPIIKTAAFINNFVS